MTGSSETADIRELAGTPNLSALYAKAALTAPTRRGTTLPSTEYIRRDATVDREHLTEYNRVCGFGLRDELPVTYPHVLSFGMSVRLMTDPGFPFALPGLVHVANSIVQRRPLRITDMFDQRVRVANLRAHPKGRQFDVITETIVSGETVWTEYSTYLRRGSAGDAPEQAGADRAGRQPVELKPGHSTAKWRLAGDLGRRYAHVSGDHNPIHLHPITAKAFGFPRTIVHGMWSKARCLASFDGRLPDACAVDVEFRKPVLLPSTVEFTEWAAGTGFDFALHAAKSGKSHLLGTVTAL